MANMLIAEMLKLQECGNVLGVLDGFACQKNDIGVPYVVGTQVFADIQAEGGGDCHYIIADGVLTLDCTSGDGIGGKARVELMQGTAEHPRMQYVYATYSETAGKVILIASESIQGIPPCMSVLYACIQTYAESDGNAVLWHRITDVASDGTAGRLSHVGKKLRLALNNNRIEGCEVRMGITTNGASRDGIEMLANAGSGFQLHHHSVRVLESSADPVMVVSNSDSCTIKNYSRLSDIGVIAQTGDGEALNDGDIIFFDIFLILNSSGLETLAIRIGRDVYTDADEASHWARAIPAKKLPQTVDQVGMSLGRAVMKYNTANGGTWTNAMYPTTSTTYWKRVNVSIQSTGYPTPPHSINQAFGGTQTITGATRMRAHMDNIYTETGYDWFGLTNGVSSTILQKFESGPMSILSTAYVGGNSIGFWERMDGSVRRTPGLASIDYIEGLVTETIGSVSGDMFDMR